jgi:type II secretory pathway pseudopilin PulG
VARRPSTTGPTRRAPAGYTLIELLFGLGIGVTVGAAAMPQLLTGLDDLKTAAAAQYLSTRFHRARMEAVLRSAAVAVVFTQNAGSYSYAVYVDGNGNGVLSRDIQNGVDRPIGAVERLPEQFTGVDIGVLPGLPPIDAGGTPPGSDPIRLGAGNSASFSATGTSTSGTVYLRGRGGAQYAVRVFGDTGRTRRLKFDRAVWQWKPL